MNNKGYTMIEAVVAMFLLVVMVGAVFSALMSGRRAITVSTEREEVFYSLQSTYGMLKDCRENQDNCRLFESPQCRVYLVGSTEYTDYTTLKDCPLLFTFGFGPLCGTSAPDNFLGYRQKSTPIPFGADFITLDEGGNITYSPNSEDGDNFEELSLVANCKEGN